MKSPILNVYLNAEGTLLALDAYWGWWSWTEMHALRGIHNEALVQHVLLSLTAER